MTTPSLPAALLAEIDRVEKEVMPAYQEIGDSASFALMMMKSDIERAKKGLGEGDVALMIIALQSLQEYST